MNALLLIAAISIGQAAEVRYNDGSLVNVKIDQPSIDVTTRYGKLTVPVAEIRRIEFGRHWPVGRREQLEALIRSLGSAAFKERDDATKKLFDAGPLAWPLLRAVKSDDVEATKRIDGLLRRIEDACTRDELNRPADDTILTAAFSIVGQIDAASIKVTSAHFGAHDVPLHAVRAIVAYRREAVELSVDAAGAKWVDTGFDLVRGQVVELRADGQVDIWTQQPGMYMVGPKGYATAAVNETVPSGALTAKFGDEKTTHLVGEQSELRGEGRLYLRIAPSPWAGGNVSGAYRVRIKGRS